MEPKKLPRLSICQVLDALGLSLPRRLLGTSGASVSLENITDAIFNKNPEFNFPDAHEKAREIVEKYRHYVFDVSGGYYRISELRNKEGKTTYRLIRFNMQYQKHSSFHNRQRD